MRLKALKAERATCNQAVLTKVGFRAKGSDTSGLRLRGRTIHMLKA